MKRILVKEKKKLENVSVGKNVIQLDYLTANGSTSVSAQFSGEDLYKEALVFLEINPPEYGIAAEYLYKAAMSGVAQAQFVLGNLIRDELVSRHKYGTAANWYQTAAANGFALGMYALGCACMNGQGVTLDMPRALGLFHQAAEQGLREAQFELGEFYRKGAGPNRDIKKAARWYCQAARQAHEGARAELEQIYLLRLVRLHELDAADRFLLDLLFSDDPANWVTLGLLYLRGEKLPRIDSEAVRWLCKAAERGNAKAYFNLAIMRIEGIALGQDLSRGIRLMHAASEAGYEPARRWLEEHE